MEKEDKTIGFEITQIATEQFAIITEVFQEGKDVQINHELNFGIDKINKRMLVRKTARYHHIDSSPFMIITVSCQFSISNNDWQYLENIETDEIIIPRTFAIHLTMLTVGTLRGILHAKTENTQFNRYIFPPFNVEKLIPNILSFD
ncbi:MAG: hypothetical protein U5N85_12050 [Arcicella sp.]|nr:hypothetical protein [Arcicella sp.]